MTMKEILEGVQKGLIPQEVANAMLLELAKSSVGNGGNSEENSTQKDAEDRPRAICNVTKTGGFTLRPVHFGSSPTNKYPFGWADQWLTLLDYSAEVIDFIYCEAGNPRTGLTFKVFAPNGKASVRSLTVDDLPEREKFVRTLIDRLNDLLPEELRLVERPAKPEPEPEKEEKEPEKSEENQAEEKTEEKVRRRRAA